MARFEGFFFNAGLAAFFTCRARKLHCNNSFGIKFFNTVYTSDAMTIDSCLLLFSCALFRTSKTAIRLHMPSRLRGNIPAFIHISDGKTHEISILGMLAIEAGVFYVLNHGYLFFDRLFAWHQAEVFFVLPLYYGFEGNAYL